MRKIYVIFSSTDLKIGRMIRFVTQNSYNHCSVSLRKDMSEFYSFSRLYLSNPLIAGFAVESPMRYTLSSRTGVKIVEVPVPETKFRAVERMIAEMSRRSEEYVYNYFSAAAYLFGAHFQRDNAYTCAEFTNNVLKTAGIEMPKAANIEQMEGALKDYPTWEGRAVDCFSGLEGSWGGDRYLEHIGKRRSCVQIAKRLMMLMPGHA